MIRIRVVLVIMVMIVEVVMIMVMRNGNHEKMVGVLWMEFKDRRELYLSDPSGADLTLGLVFPSPTLFFFFSCPH